MTKKVWIPQSLKSIAYAREELPRQRPSVSQTDSSRDMEVGEGSEKLRKGVFRLASIDFAFVFNSVIYANGWPSEKVGNNYVNKSLDSLLLVQSQLTMEIDIAFASMLFIPKACFLVLSWTFKELYFDRYLSLFAIEIVTCACIKCVMSCFFLIIILRSFRCTFTWFGFACFPAVCEAEERKTRNMFFSHTAESLSTSVRGT